MDRLKAIDLIYQGKTIECTFNEYTVGGIRDELQSYAGKMIDAGDGLRATIALQEVKRLDEKFFK